MSLNVKCDVCGWPMTMMGAVVNSPPITEGPPLVVEKFHICTLCWATKVKKLVTQNSGGEPRLEQSDPRRSTHDGSTSA